VDKPNAYIPDNETGRKVRLATAATLLASIGGMEELWGGPKEPDDPLKNIDIDAEYKLIEQKKSKLSKRMRDLVVERHKKGYNKCSTGN
jgi:hypothetical protein